MFRHPNLKKILKCVEQNIVPFKHKFCSIFFKAIDYRTNSFWKQPLSLKHTKFKVMITCRRGIWGLRSERVQK